MALTGTDSVLLPSDAVLKFSHSHPLLKNDPLYVRSGANAIKWGYHLNTQVTPTYGGEVVQVLSCNVGPITIQGQTMGRRHSTAAGVRDANYTGNDELKRIMDWFLIYMHLAGSLYIKGHQLDGRDERGILFEYPARGWSFYIQITALEGFKYALDQQHSAPWSITAEIVSDNDVNYFATTTMERFTDAVTSRALLSRMNRFASIGFDPNSPTINPESSANAVKDLKQFHNNFQTLVAAWATGDYAHFGFDQLADSGANFTQNSREYWTQVFGSDYINGGPTGGTGLGSPVTYTGDVNSTTRSDIVTQIAAVFDNNNIPGDIGVAVAMNESGLDPDNYQGKPGQPSGDGAVGLFQTFAVSDATGSPGRGAAYHKAEIWSAQQNPNQPVTKYYPVGLQIADAASWFASALKTYGVGITDTTDDHTKASFAKYAQGAGDASYVSKIENLLPTARGLISKYASVAGSSLVIPSGDSTTLAKQLLAVAGTKWKDDNGRGLAQIQKVANGQLLSGAQGQVPLDPRTMKVILWLISAGFVIGTYAWCEDHSDDGPHGHAAGFAVDISSINGVAINQDSYQCQVLTTNVARKLHNAPGELYPRQLITGGFGNHRDTTLSALSIPSADDYYGSATMQEHTNHIHVGY